VTSLSSVTCEQKCSNSLELALGRPRAKRSGREESGEETRRRRLPRLCASSLDSALTAKRERACRRTITDYVKPALNLSEEVLEIFKTN